MIKAVIFDFDGVLVDSVRIHTEAIIEVLKPYVKLSFDDLKKYAGLKTIDILRDIQKNYGFTADIGELKEEKAKLVLKNLDEIKLFKGVKKTLSILTKSGLKLAVATSGQSKRTVDLLKNNKAYHYFSAVIGFDKVKNAKPAPDLFLQAAHSLNINPEDALVVEDAPLGIKAGKKAGMKVVALTNTFDKNKLYEADYVINDIEELPFVIGEVQDSYRSQ